MAVTYEPRHKRLVFFWGLVVFHISCDDIFSWHCCNSDMARWPRYGKDMAKTQDKQDKAHATSFLRTGGTCQSHPVQDGDVEEWALQEPCERLLGADGHLLPPCSDE